QWRLEGRRKQERRQEDEQHQVRVERDVGESGEESKAQPTEHEEARIGDADASGNLEQDRDDDELEEEGAQQVHVPRLSVGPVSLGPPIATDSGLTTIGHSDVVGSMGQSGSPQTIR